MVPVCAARTKVVRPIVERAAHITRKVEDRQVDDDVRRLVAMGLAGSEETATKLLKSMQNELTAQLIIANALDVRLYNETAKTQMDLFLKRRFANLDRCCTQKLVDHLWDRTASEAVLAVSHICNDYACAAISNIVGWAELEWAREAKGKEERALAN